MPDIHAKLFSPSKAEGWFACAGRPVMEAPFPDSGSQASDEGTARHFVCAEVLDCDTPVAVADFVGRRVDLGHKTVEYRKDWVDEDQDYVDTIRGMAAGGELHVEQRVDFRRFIEAQETEDGFGTADAIILKPLADSTHELIVADRKTGYHEVPVERNKQLMLYALGAYDEHSLVYDISRVRLVIHQRKAREWDMPAADLLEFANEARSRAVSVMNAASMHGKVDQAEWEATFLNPEPSEDACRYCKAMATCPAMTRKVQETVGASFDDLAATPVKAGDAVAIMADRTPDKLPLAMAAAGLIEDWIKAVRGEVERRLLAGTPVPGFKLVLGKAGARKWTDAQAAEDMLRKTFRLPVDKAFDLSLISPTTAEELAKAGDIGKKQWPKLQPLIGRADPKPSVAPATDPRDVWTPADTSNDFESQAREPDLA
jgi:hypothetical protein